MPECSAFHCAISPSSSISVINKACPRFSTSTPSSLGSSGGCSSSSCGLDNSFALCCSASSAVGSTTVFQAASNSALCRKASKAWSRSSLSKPLSLPRSIALTKANGSVPATAPLNPSRAILTWAAVISTSSTFSAIATSSASCNKAILRFVSWIIFSLRRASSMAFCRSSSALCCSCSSGLSVDIVAAMVCCWPCCWPPTSAAASSF
mmetsp:Transcript_33695/g.85162  ORF Transcript_33695/g.85162 Transcript_33695/m.85162 type:complete len:208 (+) Transcript_33695:1636-2259(+)